MARGQKEYTEEYKNLLKKHAKLEEENEILKKAMGIFAKK
jgi:transposase